MSLEIVGKTINGIYVSELTGGILGEVRMFALSISGAVTISALQTSGWAICDGTTSSSQGVDNAVITTAPDLQDKFIMMSNDETSGTTGGTTTHSHTQSMKNRHVDQAGTYDVVGGIGGTDTTGADGDLNNWTTQSVSNIPPHYELALFIKVRP